MYRNLSCCVGYIHLIVLFVVLPLFCLGPSSLCQLEVAIDTVAGVDQAGYRPLHWILFGKALVVGTGHVSPMPFDCLAPAMVPLFAFFSAKHAATVYCYCLLLPSTATVSCYCLLALYTATVLVWFKGGVSMALILRTG